MLSTIGAFLAGIVATTIVAALVIKNNKTKFIKYLTDIDFDQIITEAGADARLAVEKIKLEIKAKIDEVKK